MNTQVSSGLRRAALALALPLITVGALTACGASSTAGPQPSAPASASASASASAATESHLISRNGRRLAFHVTPGRLPAIVLDAGGGEDSSYWNELVPQLSRATGSKIITYDRAGLGDSDEVKGPWNARAAAADLRAGLRQLSVARNVILVSHSQAGEVATYLVREDPPLVSSAVLVDANLPPFFTDAQIARIEAATAPQIEALKKQPSTRQHRQLIATAANFGPAHHAYHQVSWPNAVPATVIVSEKTPFDGSPEDAQHWRDAAAAFADGPGRTLVTAAGSSHDIPQDQPQLVLAEIVARAGAHH